MGKRPCSPSLMPCLFAIAAPNEGPAKAKAVATDVAHFMIGEGVLQLKNECMGERRQKV
jgi:hypothetical protein